MDSFGVGPVCHAVINKKVDLKENLKNYSSATSASIGLVTLVQVLVVALSQARIFH